MASFEVAPGFCHCGCGERTALAAQTAKRNGWVKGEPLKFVRFHQARQPGVPRWIEEDRGYETPCWAWQWTHDKGDGYGHVTVNGRRLTAHRAVYEEMIGSIPEGLELDHLCRFKRCVNPAHLEPVTHIENQRRGNATKLTVEEVAEIRASTDSTAELAKRHEVNWSTINSARKMKSWRDV